MSQGLKAVAGVVDATVSYDDQRADVQYRPDIVAPGKLVEAVEATGYGAALLDESQLTSFSSPRPASTPCSRHIFLRARV